MNKIKKEFDINDANIMYKLSYFECQKMVSNKEGFCLTLSSMMKEHRYQHSFSVAKTAYKIALKTGLYDPKTAFIAGLLHDCGKDIERDKESEIMTSYFAEYKDFPHYAWHEFTGRYLAETVFNIKDENILDAIMFHCTGHNDMKPLEMIVYAADKVEPKRDFKTKYARSLCYKDILKGFKYVIKDQKRFLLEKNINYMNNKFTIGMYQQYLGEQDEH